MRKPVSRRSSEVTFTRTAKRVRKINVAPGVCRGGIRL